MNPIFCLIRRYNGKRKERYIKVIEEMRKALQGVKECNHQ